MRRNGKLLFACAVLLTLLTVVVATTYYWSMQVPSEKIIGYGAGVYIDGVKWVNGTKLTWDVNDTKQLDVVNLGTVPAYAYVTTQGLPTNWNLTWTKDGLIFYPNEWLNGTLTLQHTNENGTYIWDMWVHLGN